MLHLKWYDVLLGVLDIGNQNCTVHQDVIEQEKVSWFDAISAGFCQHTLCNQNSS